MPESRVTLEDLIKLKRHEEPEPAFWDRFDHDFEHRRLRALMNDGEPEESAFGTPWLRQVGWAFGALAAALAISFVGLTRQTNPLRSLVSESQRGAAGMNATVAHTPGGVAEHAESEHLTSLFASSEPTAETVVNRSVPEARFIVDAIPSPAETTHFQRVLANPAFLPVWQNGAEFVADTLTTSGRSRATFLVDRPRGQF